MMRWASRFSDGEGSAVDLHSSGSDPASLRGYWAALITDIRFADALFGIPAEAHLPLARANLKTAARWSRLLNDIPPPTITWNPTTRVATVKRGTKPDNTDIGAGRLYAKSSESLGDPIYDYPSPDCNSPPYPSQITITAHLNDKFVYARVYSFDIDSDRSWSAITVFEIP